MPVIAIVCGIILIPIGWVAFDQTGRTHYTALIPAGLGLLLIVLGGLSFRPGMRKHAMHLAAVVGLAGALAGGFRAVPGWVSHLSGKEVSMPALIGTSLTALVCLVFLGLCINSFIQARRRRQQEALK